MLAVRRGLYTGKSEETETRSEVSIPVKYAAFMPPRTEGGRVTVGIEDGWLRGVIVVILPAGKDGDEGVWGACADKECDVV